MMMVDNIIRELNKIHMILPLVVIAIPLVVVYMMPLYYYPIQVIPYCIYIVVQVRYQWDNNDNQKTNSLYYDLIMKVMITVWMIVLIVVQSYYYYRSQEEEMNRTNVVRTSTTSLFLDREIFRFLIIHIAWVGLCYFMNINAEMANEILLAPWQELILLDNK